MATVTYNFTTGQTVWHITEDCGIKEGVVRVVNIEIISGTTTITYTVQYSGETDTVVANEADLYATLESGGSPDTGALAAYKAQLEA